MSVYVTLCTIVLYNFYFKDLEPGWTNLLVITTSMLGWFSW